MFSSGCLHCTLFYKRTNFIGTSRLKLVKKQEQSNNIFMVGILKTKNSINDDLYNF